MAKRTVRWSERAINDKLMIFAYWIERNQSIAYPTKLENLFDDALATVAVFPLTGRATEKENVRMLIVKNYKVVYRISEELIEVITVWMVEEIHLISKYSENSCHDLFVQLSVVARIYC